MSRNAVLPLAPMLDPMNAPQGVLHVLDDNFLQILLLRRSKNAFLSPLCRVCKLACDTGASLPATNETSPKDSLVRRVCALLERE